MSRQAEAYMAVSVGAFGFQRHMLELTGLSFYGQVAKGNDPLFQLFIQVILFQVAVNSASH